MKRYGSILRFIFLISIVVVIMACSPIFQKPIGEAYKAFLNLDPGKQTELLFTFLSSIIGTFVGAIFALGIALCQFSIQKSSELKQRRLETTLDFHREWVSVDFMEARFETNKIFTEHRKDGNLDGFYSDLSVERKSNIRMVLAFFRRLQLDIEHKRVDDELTKELFGGEFLWFYYKWFKDVIPDGWTTKKSVEKINEWMVKELQKDEYERAKSEASSEREDLFSRSDSSVT